MTDARKPRLGDVVDDYCSKCRLIMNHGIMATDGIVIFKTRCNTCMSEHKYRGGKIPRGRKDPIRDAYAQLLGKISRPPASGSAGPGRAGEGGGPHIPLAPEDSGDEPEEE